MTSRILPTYAISLGSPTLPGLEAGDFVEFITTYSIVLAQNMNQ